MLNFISGSIYYLKILHCTWKHLNLNVHITLFYYMNYTNISIFFNSDSNRNMFSWSTK